LKSEFRKKYNFQVEISHYFKFEIILILFINKILIAQHVIPNKPSEMTLNKAIVTFCILFLAQLTIGQEIKKSGNDGMKIFRAAVVKVDITPDDPQMLAGYAARKSTGVHDHIYHRIVVLDDGTTQFFLVSTDIGKISPSEYDNVAAQLKKKFGIDPQNFWWSVTHTHSAPEVGTPGLSIIFLPERYTHPIALEYTKFFEKKLIDGIAEARQKLAPARLGVGWGFSQANINRRAIDVDGKASIGLNPDGPVDNRIGLLRIEKEDGSPLALIANYPMHGTVLGPPNLNISGDAPGIVSAYVEEKTGVPMLYINGAAGNLAPIYSVYPNPRDGHLNEFRVLLGDKILEANRLISSTTKEVQLNTGSIIVETPRKEMAWPAELKTYNRTTKEGINMVRLPVRFMKINNEIAIWSAPLELFCEISNGIREHSPFPYTFYYGYTNGSLGYLLTEDEYKYGGYEPKVSPFTPAAAKALTESVSNQLKGGITSR
jgi:neutral ceramidase